MQTESLCRGLLLGEEGRLPRQGHLLVWQCWHGDGAVGNGPGNMELEQVLWATLVGSRETRCPEPLSGRSVGPCGFRVLSPDTSCIPAPPAS